MPDRSAEVAPTDGPSRAQRAFAVGVLALLLVGGLREVEAWPLTAWRLFSEPRRAEQGGWSVQALDADGAATPVALGELALGYRQASWRFQALSDAPAAERRDVCQALLEGVREEQPAAVALEVLRTRGRLVERDGRWWSVEVSTDRVATCEAGGGR